MRGIAAESLQAAVAQLKFIGKGQPIFSVGPCEHPSRQLPRTLWAHPTVSVAAVPTPNGPIPANLSNIGAHKMGPCDGVGLFRVRS
jgi:hypothetical protein